MKNSFPLIKEHAEELSILSAEVIDETVIYYAAVQYNLIKAIDNQLHKYRDATANWPSAFINVIKSQLIAHYVFKKDGAIHKMLNHKFIKDLASNHYQFLQKMAQSPWRFTFCTIIEQPHSEFFMMWDVFREEKFLLYSPGMQAMNYEIETDLWLLQTSFNGECWQTFGLIIPLPTLLVDDIFFYATEKSDMIEDETDLLHDLDQNPFHYLLLHAINIPNPEINPDQSIDHWISLDTPTNIDLDIEKCRKYFKEEKSKHVYQLIRKRKKEKNLLIAYYNETDKTISRIAYTEDDFKSLTKDLNKIGFDLPMDADVHISHNMVGLIAIILKKQLLINPYWDIFFTEEEIENMFLLKEVLAIVKEQIDNNQKINADEIAKELGIEVDIVNEILRTALLLNKDSGNS